MSDSQRNPPAPDFQPMATAASLRMLNSVMARVSLSPTSREDKQRHPEQSAMPVGVQAQAKTEQSAVSGESQPVLGGSWVPAGTRTAAQLQEQRDVGAPLWSTLPKADLKPVVVAVEADLGKHQAAELVAARGGSRLDRGDMRLLEGQEEEDVEARNLGGVMPPTRAQRAAVDASARLLEAVRSQVAAQSIASDNRISLGDLTLIAFADSKKQMAASSTEVDSVPDPRPLEKAIDNSAHKKLLEDKKGFMAKLKKIADICHEDLKKSAQVSKERFG